MEHRRATSLDPGTLGTDGGIEPFYSCSGTDRLVISYFTASPNEFYPDGFWKGILVYVALAVVGAAWFLIEARRPERQSQSRS